MEENVSLVPLDEAKTFVRQLFDRTLRHFEISLHAATGRAAVAPCSTRLAERWNASTGSVILKKQNEPQRTVQRD
jgi:hypothetical protein